MLGSLSAFLRSKPKGAFSDSRTHPYGNARQHLFSARLEEYRGKCEGTLEEYRGLLVLAGVYYTQFEIPLSDPDNTPSAV